MVPGLDARLPWEAEWEYGCRAGTQTAYFWGDEPDVTKMNCEGYRVSRDNERNKKDNEEAPIGQTVPVTRYDPNPWGLYQMHGNVWEWCADAWHEHLGTDSGNRSMGGCHPPAGSRAGWRAAARGSTVARNARSACPQQGRSRLAASTDVRLSSGPRSTTAGHGGWARRSRDETPCGRENTYEN
jgi:formylglycine-generating enzyme required for sulfatase activity